jgi:UDP-GlcNAc:undecaprenyl-phosphate GlcNAc-1-phosphate transferase
MRRQNYRGLQLAFPLGAGLVVVALAALAPLALYDGLTCDQDGFGCFAAFDEQSVDHDLLGWLPYLLGVAFLGLLDDALGRGGAAGSPRGWRGHAQAVRSGELSTGAIKALGALAIAATVLAHSGLGPFDYVVAVLLLVLTTNLFNLLDLGPGRAEKALVLLGAGLCLGAWTAEPLELLGVFLGPVLVGAWFTLRERAMLGDTGSNLIGAIAGVWMLETLDDSGRLVALGLVAALTIYGELRSISQAIESIPPLRSLDSLGRVDEHS